MDEYDSDKVVKASVDCPFCGEENVIYIYGEKKGLMMEWFYVEDDGCEHPIVIKGDTYTECGVYPEAKVRFEPVVRLKGKYQEVE